ncbi:alpha/beta hydrolase [Spirosoma sp. SC4-14]|uniref:alpha/beta hydrolase n=1 Tax=Spirosoma sp. SC4-14 TaxID=3128900 RepID=UPI0030D4F81F
MVERTPLHPERIHPVISLHLIWQIPACGLALIVLILLANEYAIARASRRVSDIPYVQPGQVGFMAKRQVLDVFIPKSEPSRKKPVVLFIHGGNWDSGNKNLYSFVGRRLASLGIVAVVINYRLAPQVRLPDMAADCAQAVWWVTTHIANYSGDPDQLFVMGHSAGGGLAALLATDELLFAKLGLTKNPIRGAILDDPAGLDMFDYLTKMEYPGDEQYLIPWGNDPAIWRANSALYHLDAGSPPMLLFVGERTYPSIIGSSRRFNQRLQELKIAHSFTILPGKKHVAMVTQLFWKSNIIYRDLQKFIRGN